MLSLQKDVTQTLGKRQAESHEYDYVDQTHTGFSSDEDVHRPRHKKRAAAKLGQIEEAPELLDSEDPSISPRTMHILSIINSRDVSQIKLLKGVGAKKAEALVDCLCEMDQASLDTTDNESVSNQSQFQVNSLAQLSQLKGVGVQTVENMRQGVLA